ncbi:putative hemolysin [Brevundimonas sp. Root1279]|uniref:putative hemolysin n=1 Tax=Brevundimonas sp. Root1279 TaxID=1736443 RepID=UPI0006FA5678|nr:DUF333 domain-containing protein [Brevundimonas sp. Root1279]KQW86620.1 hypothetical protein ASC65_01635 [Brevundimonas sp. Root1279]
MVRMWKACLPLLPLLAAACAPPPPAPPEPPAVVGLPNPASVNCVNQGGVHQVRKTASGDEYGVCLFSDGRQCEEWALLRDKRCVAPSPDAP